MEEFESLLLRQLLRVYGGGGAGNGECSVVSRERDKEERRRFCLLKDNVTVKISFLSVWLLLNGKTEKIRGMTEGT